MLERVPTANHADWSEYQLTRMGRQLAPTLMALMH
jgi:hypothetical protein